MRLKATRHLSTLGITAERETERERESVCSVSVVLIKDRKVSMAITADQAKRRLRSTVLLFFFSLAQLIGNLAIRKSK